jgi:D-glycero-alpha-D-manno-heptose-7-phosphate kinase
MIVTTIAPIRICDCGGWTDTWFARHGRVFNVAVGPCATVRVETFAPTAHRPRLVIHAVDFGERYAPLRRPGAWDRHPLLEAAIDALPVPDEVAMEVSVSCAVPPGASTGTSAAVTVALLGALDRVRGGSMGRRDLARAAHAVETDRLGQQSGIQDQICSAMGGLNLIEMTAYPEADVRALPLSAALRADLERRLTLVVLARGHRSSAVHERVIQRLAALGPECEELDALRRAATAAAEAVVSGDLVALGQAMADNTEAQRRLHPSLICADAAQVIAVAREHGATGWKVNGAGGEGGSLTILGPAAEPAGGALRRALGAAAPGARAIRVSLDFDGVRAW